jgi:hypothetical protein
MEITARYLRRRAAMYRSKAAAAKKPLDARRYQEFAELLEEQAALFESHGEPNESSPAERQPPPASA